jgi:hypothetical protein
VTRWAVVTIGLYLLLLLILTPPLVKAAFWEDTDWPDVPDMYTLPGIWILIGILATAQACLLLVPVRAAKGLHIKFGPAIASCRHLRRLPFPGGMAGLGGAHRGTAFLLGPVGGAVQEFFIHDARAAAVDAAGGAVALHRKHL